MIILKCAFWYFLIPFVGTLPSFIIHSLFLLYFFEPLFHFVKTHHHAQVLRKGLFVLFFKLFLITYFRPTHIVTIQLDFVRICKHFLHESTNAPTWILALVVQPILFNKVTDQRRSHHSIQGKKYVVKLNMQE
jgi:hypothetical protein